MSRSSLGRLSLQTCQPGVAGMSEVDPPSVRIEEAASGIAESAELVRALLDTVPALMWSASADGEPSYVNQRVVEYTGRSVKDFAKLGWLAIIHPDDLEETFQKWSHATRTGGSYRIKHRLRRADGEYRWFSARGEPFLGAEGRVLHYFGLAIDITEQEQLTRAMRESEEEFRQIVDLAPQLVGVLGPKGERRYMNSVALSYLGISLDEWLQGSLGDQIHPDDRERQAAFFSKLLSEPAADEIEVQLPNRDGIYRWFLARFSPVLDHQGQVHRWYIACTDIEERKKVAERLQHENVVLREEIDKTSMFEEIVGVSPVLTGVLLRVAKVAPSDATVLITGETGTGKELVARAIHRQSRRSSRAFVAVNCAAIPKELVASELFGHEKGAFTGATQRRLGRFELGDGGTIFLDEVGELSPCAQASLL
jgi:PAS domain S-box-containing protein